ncbi:MAG: SRPBCC domain-containing protein [Leptonema sp. (in: bacteria)]
MKTLLISYSNKNKDFDSIEEKEWIHAPIEWVFEAITNSEWIDSWGGGPSKFHSKKGGKFFLWDGEIYGTVIDLVKPNKISFSLREKFWPNDWKDSYVVIHLFVERSGTRMILQHSQFPEKKVKKKHEEGWGEYYIGPLKAYLENLYYLKNQNKNKNK